MREGERRKRYRGNQLVTMSKRNTRVVRIDKKYYDKLKSFDYSITGLLNELIEESSLLKKPIQCSHCDSKDIICGRSRTRGYTLCLDCGKVSRYSTEVMRGVAIYENPWTEERCKWIQDKKAQLMQIHGVRCQHCNQTDATRCYFQLDHKIPQLFSGSDNDENLQILCHCCNAKKHIHLTEHELKWIKDTRTIAGFLDKIINEYKNVDNSK